MSDDGIRRKGTSTTEKHFFKQNLIIRKQDNTVFQKVNP